MHEKRKKLSKGAQRELAIFTAGILFVFVIFYFFFSRYVPDRILLPVLVALSSLIIGKYRHGLIQRDQDQT